MGSILLPQAQYVDCEQDPTFSIQSAQILWNIFSIYLPFYIPRVGLKWYLLLNSLHEIMGEKCSFIEDKKKTSGL